MILEKTIEQVSEQQRNRIETLDYGLRRELLSNIKLQSSYALIISGIRRCGKSTLLMQIIKELNLKEYIYINFETPQLYGFSLNDFLKIDNIIKKQNSKILFFDEIQLVDKWEIYIRQKLDEGFQVVITGPNASLLSYELGTKLTGRHITKELFPFSYNEFLAFKELLPNSDSLELYLKTGGFPEYLKSNDSEQLSTLFDDILIRDIVARYGIKDIRTIQRLSSYLISNVGNKITASKLKQPLSIGATSTVLNWLSYLELSYLFFLLPMYSNSVKAQMVNPKKIYSIDNGLINVNSISFTEDKGRKFENLIFLHLKRRYQELYYFNFKKECDFIVMNKNSTQIPVQVCYELTNDNADREIEGLLEAMKFFNQRKAFIVTFDTSDKVIKDDKEIEIIPAFKFLIENIQYIL